METNEQIRSQGRDRLLSSAAPVRPSKSPVRERPKPGDFSAGDPTVDEKGNIKVVCRFRPLNDRERAMNLGTCVDFSPDNKTVGMVSSADQTSSAPLKFTYDAVFPPSSHQIAVYEYAARPTVESVLEGFNGTVFAYGQTGSGKTFTMTGPNVDDEDLKGIIPRMINTVFEKIRNASDDLEFTVKVGYAEIYMEKIKDLLEPANSNLKIHEDKTRGVYIAELTEQYVSEEQEVYEIMKLGSANREVGATLMNEGSSRSHSLFLMTITQNNVKDYSAKTGKLYLIDLAGSEKVGKTGAEGKRLDEAKNINKSLSTLGQVINALTDGKSTHIPYRDSKLTRVLQDSIGGNSKTALIITCSPSPYNEAETISTLRFGIRAKAIKNKPKINREYTVAELKLLLAKAEAEITKKSAVIDLLNKRLLELGVNPPTEADFADLREEENKESGVKSESPELAELGLEMDDLREKLEEERKANSELTREVLNAAESSARFQAEIDDLTLKIKTMELEFGPVQEGIKDKEDEIISLRSQVQGLEDTLVIVRTTMAALEEKNAELQGQKPFDEEIRSLTSRASSSRLLEELEIKELQCKEMKARLDLQEEILQKIGSSTGDVRILQLLQTYRNSDPGQIISAQEQLQAEKNRNQQLFEEVSKLNQQMNNILTNKVPSYEELRKKAANDAVAKEKVKWESEKNMILRDLQNRIDKVVRLEIELDETQESYNLLFASLSDRGDAKLKAILSELQQEKEQLSFIYQTALREKSLLSQTVDTQKHKLARLEERLKATETKYAETLQQMTEQKTKIEELGKQYDDINSRTSLRSLSFAQHIKKRIKGGVKHDHEKSIDLSKALSPQPFEIQEEALESGEPENRAS